MPPRSWRCEESADEVTDEFLPVGDGSWQPEHKPGWLCRHVGSTGVEYWELLVAGSSIIILIVVIGSYHAWRQRQRRQGPDEGSSTCSCCCCSSSADRAAAAAITERLVDGHYRGAIKTGYLQKQGHLRKNWKQRFFVLEQSVMLYYERPSDLQPKGTVRMDDITLALATEITGKPHCFGIFHPSRDPYYLVARNELEMMKWVRAIRGEDKVGLVDFEVVSKLGQGHFGKVVLVRKKSANPRPGARPKFYAMKILEKKQIMARKDVAQANSERRILQQIKHPFIVRLHYAFQTGEKLYMVMDFLSGGDLYFHLCRCRRFQMELVRKWLCELVLAIEYLHSMNIVYRELKPENILLDSHGHLHLADFGLSRPAESADEELKTFCGTPYYVPPEMLKKSRRCTKGVDWWSLGVLCHELLVGQPPFYSANIDRIYEKIAKDELRLPPTVREEPRALIKALLERDPKARLGATQGAQELKQHAFFTGVDWQAVFEMRVDTGFDPQNTGDQPTPGATAHTPQQQLAVHGDHDMEGNFDPFFTRQRAADSFEQPVFRDPADQKFADSDGFSFHGTLNHSQSPPSAFGGSGPVSGPGSASVSRSTGASSHGTSGGGHGSGGHGRGYFGYSSGSRAVVDPPGSRRLSPMV
eukprot:COSAG02_NODE_218_length_28570_cov_75.594816_22_plen_642_part_00